MYKWVFAIKVNLDGLMAREDLWLKDLLSLMGWIISTMNRANITFVASVVSQYSCLFCRFRLGWSQN